MMRFARNGLVLAVTVNLLCFGYTLAAPSTQQVNKAKTLDLPGSPKQDKPHSANEDLGVIGFKFAVVPNEEASVAEVFRDTPAWTAHIEKGDYIVQIDGTSTKNLDREHLYQLLNGHPDTKIKITFRKNDKTFQKTLTRMHSAVFAKEHPDIWKLYTSSR